MLKQINHIPKCLDDHETSEKYKYYKGELDGKIYGYLATQEIKHDEIVLHVEVQNWTRTTALEIRKDFKQLLTFNKKYVRVSAWHKNPYDKKWAKFVQFMGFPEPFAMQVTSLEI